MLDKLKVQYVRVFVENIQEINWNYQQTVKKYQVWIQDVFVLCFRDI